MTQEPQEPPGETRKLRKISQEKLKEDVKNHQLWLKSAGKEGRAADWQETDLKGAVLISFDLQKANLNGAYLYGAYLKNTNLEDANLEGANLRGANLRWANLKNASLLKANLIRADLQGADLTDTDLCGSNLKMAAGLTRQQIESARTDESTILPDHLKSSA